MAKIICPDCDSEISQYSDACPTCGFPIKSFMENNKLIDTKKTWICPKCAHTHWGVYSPFPPRLKCEYCDSTLIETDEDPHELFKLSITISTEQEYNERIISIANKYGNHQFSKSSFEQRLKDIHSKNLEFDKQNEIEKQKQSKQQNVPKCPTCGSTNIKKISGTKKTASIIGFGILSNNIGKTFECLNCKYKW